MATHIHYYEDEGSVFLRNIETFTLLQDIRTKNNKLQNWSIIFLYFLSLWFCNGNEDWIFRTQQLQVFHEFSLLLTTTWMQFWFLIVRQRHLPFCSSSPRLWKAYIYWIKLMIIPSTSRASFLCFRHQKIQSQNLNRGFVPLQKSSEITKGFLYILRFQLAGFSWIIYITILWIAVDEPEIWRLFPQAYGRKSYPKATPSSKGVAMKAFW